MVWHMVTKYPDFFAAAMPIASLYNPTALEMNGLSDTSIWIFSCDKDFYTSAATPMAKTNFDYLCNITNRPGGIRLTSFTEAVLPDNQKHHSYDKEHYIWCSVTNDMFMNTGEQYYHSTTIDGEGNNISFKIPNGLISWLSRQTNLKEENGKMLSFFEKFIAIIKDFLNKILGLFGV